MSLFNDMLKDSESLFTNPVVFDYDYMPKKIRYREGENEQMASCIMPLSKKRSAKNLFIYGPPGIGKTIACRHVLQEMEESEDFDDVIPIYLNCWQKNTSYKILIEICSLLGYRLTHNKKTDELFNIIKGIINKKSAVFVFDEADKLEDSDIIYMILEDIYRSSIFIITNHREWLAGLDNRVRSRLIPEQLEFRPYKLSETSGILLERIRLGFVEGVWSQEAIDIAVNKTYEIQDIRAGLKILKEAGENAENRSSRKITPEDVNSALKKLPEFSPKKSSDLEDESKMILSIIKKSSGKKIGELFDEYKSAGGSSVYKTFQRKINKLDKDGFISTEKISGGKEGNTTIVRNRDATKKLTEF